LWKTVNKKISYRKRLKDIFFSVWKTTFLQKSLVCKWVYFCFLGRYVQKSVKKHRLFEGKLMLKNIFYGNPQDINFL